MDIRELGESDVALWRGLRSEALRTEPQAFAEDAAEFDAMDDAALAARHRTLPEGSILAGAMVDGELAAMALLARNRAAKERHKAHIYAVYTGLRFRRRGLSRVLLTYLLERASAEASLEQVELAVATSQDAARQLYRSLGFISYGIEPCALKVDGKPVDQELMILRLHRCGEPTSLG